MIMEHFHIVLPKGYKQVLKIAAAKAAISMSELVRLALDNHLTQGSLAPQRSSKNGSKAYDKSD